MLANEHTQADSVLAEVEELLEGAAAEAAAHGASVAGRQGRDRQAQALGRLSQTMAGKGERARTPALEAIVNPSPLTERELDIARLAATGLASKDIAGQLHLSVRTVDNYLGRIFTKLGAAKRSELAGLLSTEATGLR
ncbi:MAG: response regulator transcription factor [Pseudonocardiaceae bacterium]